MRRWRLLRWPVPERRPSAREARPRVLGFPPRCGARRHLQESGKAVRENDFIRHLTIAFRAETKKQRVRNGLSNSDGQQLEKRGRNARAHCVSANAWAVVRVHSGGGELRERPALRRVQGDCPAPERYRRQGALGAISKRGGPSATLLIHGARSAIAHQRRAKRLSPWFSGLLERRPFNVTVAALANKMARTAWALAAHGGRTKQTTARKRRSRST